MEREVRRHGEAPDTARVSIQRHQRDLRLQLGPPVHDHVIAVAADGQRLRVQGTGFVTSGFSASRCQPIGVLLDR